MANYSVLLTTGWRVDCSGKRIGQAMRQLAKSRPEIAEFMTSTYITYINGIASVYSWKSNKESRRAIESIKQVLFSHENLTNA